MIDRLLGELLTNDPAVRVGRIIGNVIGIALFPILAWVVMQSLFGKALFLPTRDSGPAQE